MNDFTIGPPLGVMSKRIWGGDIPPAPDGAQLHFMMMATSNGVHHQGVLAMVLPKMDGPIHISVECLAHNFAPPETDAQRRRRLVAQVLERAREAGRLGLTTDDQTTTVDAILSALNAEFAEEPPFPDDNSEDYDDQDDD